MRRLPPLAGFVLCLSVLLVGCAAEPVAPERPQEHPWRHEAADGTVHLWSVDYMHVMNMVAWCLQQQRYDLLLDEVISDQTKAEYQNLGREPAEAVQWMVQNEADINRLFSLLRASRGRVENAGYKRVRLTLYGPLRDELRITQMEVVMENRVWKLAVIR